MTVVRAYQVPHSANQGKIEQVAALLPHWQRALRTVQGVLLRGFYESGRLPKYLDTKTFSSPLSQRQLRSVVNQACTAVASWSAGMVPLFRDTVTGSTLPADVKVALYRTNIRQAWFRQVGDLSFDVTAEQLRLARAIFKHLVKTHPVPELSSVRTMLMDGPIARVTDSKTHQFTHWLNVATLAKGSPVQIPVTGHQHFNQANGTLSNYAQVHVGRTNQVSFALVKKSDAAPPRNTGRVVGLDWGLKSVFSTSEGQLLGIQLYDWLQARDVELTELTAALQRQSVSLKTNKRYQALQQRIRGHVTNEIGRLLNCLAADDIKELVVEKLDFRHGGLSRRMNRIVSRTGRATVESKLADVAETRGVKITHVNPAYSSQRCTGCGFTHRLNRTGTVFRCRFCGYSLHADVNAARNLVARRSDDALGGLYVSKQKIKAELDRRFQQRWNTAGPALDTPRGARRCSSPIRYLPNSRPAKGDGG